MENYQQKVEENGKALDLLHEAIIHTPLTLKETAGTDYDKGYIFYQDMVVKAVKGAEPKLLLLLESIRTTARAEGAREAAERIAKRFSDGGKEELAQYILAQEDLIPTFIPQ